MWHILFLIGILILVPFARLYFEWHCYKTAIYMQRLVRLEKEGGVTNKQVDDAIFLGRFPKCVTDDAIFLGRFPKCVTLE